VKRMEIHGLAWLACLAIAAVAFAQTGTFTGIGVLDGDAESAAFGVSDDGTIIVGHSIDGSGDAMAVLYEVASGSLSAIDRPAGWATSTGLGVDIDSGGSVHITGEGRNSYGNMQAFYYSSVGGGTFTAIPFLDGAAPETGTSAGNRLRVADDGEAMVVGRSSRGSDPDHAFRWRTTSPGGSLDLGDVPPSIDISYAQDLGFFLDAQSAIRTRVVGTGFTSYPYGGSRPGAFSWSSQTSINSFLGFLDSSPTNDSQSFARGVSADARYIVGNGTYESFCGLNLQAYLYDVTDQDPEDTGAPKRPLQLCADPNYPNSRLLGYVPGHEGFSEALAVALDGSVVVGCARSVIDAGGGDCYYGEEDAVAMIWDPYNGARALKAVLENDYGLDLSGWVLIEARGISADGTVIAGTGEFNGVSRGWVATVGPMGPVGACCMPDLSCVEVMETVCTATYRGPGTLCQDVVCCPIPFPDADLDGDVDQSDFGFFQRCYSGYNVPMRDDPMCTCFDRNKDGDVDMYDFGEFLKCYTGANVPWSQGLTPDCTPTP